MLFGHGWPKRSVQGCIHSVSRKDLPALTTAQNKQHKKPNPVPKPQGFVKYRTRVATKTIHSFKRIKPLCAQAST